MNASMNEHIDLLQINPSPMIATDTIEVALITDIAEPRGIQFTEPY